MSLAAARRALRRVRDANRRAGSIGLALALLGGVLIIETLPWLAGVGIVMLVVGWVAWKGREL